MAVDIKFISVEDGSEISIDTGIDLGKSRKGVPSITSFKVKNAGDITARTVVISADTLNFEGDVSPEEFAKQQLAASWKTFSLNPEGPFVNQLIVGDLKPNSFVEGVKETVILTSNEDACQLKEVWTTGVTELKGVQHIFRKTTLETSDGQIAKRMKLPILGNVRDFDVEFNIDINYTTDNQQSDSLGFIGFPVRVGSDGLGYYFMIRFRRDDNKFQAVIYKNGKGMTTNIDRDYGKQFAVTQTWQNYSKNKSFRLRCINKNDVPTFEIIYGGTPLTLIKSNSEIVDTSIQDTDSDMKVNAGSFYLELALQKGDKYVILTDMVFRTEELEQPIYMRTYLNDKAEDTVEYRCATVVSYLES